MASASARPLVFVQLNEINFDFVERYLRTHELPSLRTLVQGFRRFETFAEQRYEELEPWIQWVSAHTGKTFAEHGVFRLGDVVKSSETLVQIFETLEAKGLRVGAISPMNARNRLRRPAFFVPDPWTDTPSDAAPFSRRLTRMLRQTVNDNATSRLSPASLATLGEAVLRTLHPARTPRLLGRIAATLRRPWLKAMVLDELVHQVHLYELARERPDVSFVFFNAGAHIQHHYFFNAPQGEGAARNPEWYVSREADPVLDMLKAYDRMLADYLALAERGTRLIVATGLSQVPYNRLKYYYRLSNHARFLKQAGIEHRRVLPRMTRDFEVDFADAPAAERGAERLRALTLERTGSALFGEVDVRGLSVFATLTYPDEIKPDDAAVAADMRIADFGRQVAFVAIKNGMHDTRGFVFVSPNTPAQVPVQPVHVAALFDLTLQAALSP